MTQYQQIFTHYGYDEQLKQLSEETGELFKALNKYRRKKHYPHMKDSLKADIVDEIADVEIMLEQFKQHFNIDTSERIVYKLKRELERIGNNDNIGKSC